MKNFWLTMGLALSLFSGLMLTFCESGQVINNPVYLRGTDAQRLAYPHSALNANDQWADTDTLNIYIWSGSSWTQINSSGTPTATITMGPTVAVAWTTNNGGVSYLLPVPTQTPAVFGNGSSYREYNVSGGVLTNPNGFFIGQDPTLTTNFVGGDSGFGNVQWANGLQVTTTAGQLLMYGGPGLTQGVNIFKNYFEVSQGPVVFGAPTTQVAVTIYGPVVHCNQSPTPTCAPINTPVGGI